MKQLLYNYLSANQTNIGILKSIEILTIALLLSLLIFATYRITFSGVMYNRKFNISLIMITLVSTMVMIVIGSDIALSLGMVGALSIVRFRTAIKDPRDTAYVFWAVAIGISIGTQNYIICIVGSAFIATILIILSIGKVGNDDRYLLIIRGKRSKEDDIMSCVFNAFRDSQLRAKNSSEDNIEIVYQIKFKRNKDKDILKNLYKIEGIEAVNMIAQNGETIG